MEREKEERREGTGQLLRLIKGTSLVGLTWCVCVCVCKIRLRGPWGRGGADGNRGKESQPRPISQTVNDGHYGLGLEGSGTCRDPCPAAVDPLVGHHLLFDILLQFSCSICGWLREGGVQLRAHLHY